MNKKLGSRDQKNVILQFCQFFHLTQLVNHFDLFKQMSGEKHLKLSYLTKGMGICICI